MYQNAPYYAGYYGADAAAESAPSAAESTAEGLIDRFRGYAAMAHSSDLFALFAAGATGLYNFFVRDQGLIASFAWGALAWGAYRITTALIAGEGFGTEPVFSLGLMGAGAGLLFAEDRGLIPAFGGGFNLFDDFSESWA